MYLHRKYFLFVAVHRLRLIIAEHEGVTPNRVPMHITVKEDLSRLECPLHHQLRVVVNREILGRTSDPLPIQIDAHQRASVISNDHTIRILHRHDFEYESISQEFGVGVIRDQEFDDTVHHPRRVRLTWVYSRS